MDAALFSCGDIMGPKIRFFARECSLQKASPKFGSTRPIEEAFKELTSILKQEDTYLGQGHS